MGYDFTYGETKNEELTNIKVIGYLYELIKEKFPIEVSVVNGEVKSFSFSAEWKEGGTTPVSREVKDETGATVFKEDGTPEAEIDYVEDYVEKRLTDEQIATLQNWAAQNVVS